MSPNALNVKPVVHTVTRGQLRANLPGYHPPLRERHPYPIALVIVVAIFGLVAVVVSITG